MLVYSVQRASPPSLAPGKGAGQGACGGAAHSAVLVKQGGKGEAAEGDGPSRPHPTDLCRLPDPSQQQTSYHPVIQWPPRNPTQAAMRLWGHLENT